MANEGQETTRTLDGLTGAAQAAAGAARTKGPPPVHLWNPPFCGDLDMRIAADGTWFYLKTPVEKVGITVDDAPFTAVEMKQEGEGASRTLSFRTNVDDWVTCGKDHALRFEPEDETGGLKPYLHVRSDLWALVTRALFYDLVELGEEREVDGKRMFGVVSGGEFFAMAPADELKGLR